ncbi:MAG: acetyl-CoA carboxylase biotin carboxyl carrier protein [Cytophagia bacterium]|nr:MAG: acetyl-CoA carboxylase biotin carboxyl carrier protein [Cytophagales bacterium]TAG36618.1 MAG: acetyl-CoA carboxylase biotin carboxyl carrier protein [Cytophagia bacterium]TAG78207.1 MAG: acetyl-CoA carboxylase biotin carboxyl carrier protein [Cytophagales bacterium]
METKEIQKLLDFIAHSPLDEVSIETSELKISVKRHSGTVVTAAAPVAAPVVVAAVAAPVAAAPAPKAPAADESKLLTIKSPMIGTFYLTPSPDKPSFVEVGDEITTGKTVCIIEAMKLFNEIESEISGRIVKILVSNATPVEFDQPLFLVEPV